jgi:hypothetical protein
MNIKKLALFCIIGFSALSINVNAQNTSDSTSTKVTRDRKLVKPVKDLTKTPAIYLGGTIGINNSGGMIGLKADMKLSDDLMVGGAFGLGSWGGKYTLSIYYVNKSNWNPMIGISKATGLDSVPIKNIMVYDKSTGASSEQEVVFKYNSVTLINFGVQKQWVGKRRGNRVYIDAGYSFPISGKDTYSLRNSNLTLSRDAKTSMDLVSPGGIIIGGGYCFRIF